MAEKLRLYIDMDNVIVDFMSGVERVEPAVLESHYKLHGQDKNLDEIEGVFALMDPMPGAIEAVMALAESFDTYILSSSPWLNPSAWSDKLNWIHRHFGHSPESPLYKRVILSHNKHLNAGDFLIDDRPNNGAAEFAGEWVHFGSPGFETWEKVVEHLSAAQARIFSEMNQQILEVSREKLRTGLGETRLWTSATEDQITLHYLDSGDKEIMEGFPRTLAGLSDFLNVRRERITEAGWQLDQKNIALALSGKRVSPMADSQSLELDDDLDEDLTYDQASRVAMYFEQGLDESDTYNFSGIERDQNYAFNRLWDSLTVSGEREEQSNSED